MGAFDDAIREHLELKRRQGASDEDIKRQEEEALGPGAVRFARPETATAPPAEKQAAGADDAVYEPAEPSPETSTETPETAPAALAEPGEVALESPEQPPPAAALQEEAAPPALDSQEQPAPPDLDDELEPDEVLPDESLEPSVEEDLLEETPNFLEESPDQDRLWFEQRAPKDFDFGD
jgi:hypothetical protein